MSSFHHKYRADYCIAILFLSRSALGFPRDVLRTRADRRADRRRSSVPGKQNKLLLRRYVLTGAVRVFRKKRKVLARYATTPFLCPISTINSKLLFLHFSVISVLTFLFIFYRFVEFPSSNFKLLLLRHVSSVNV